MIEKRISEIISNLSLEEKVGQLNLTGRSPVGGADVTITDMEQMLQMGKISQEEFDSALQDVTIDSQEDDVAAGKIGGFLGYIKPNIIRHLQQIAVEKSKSGIPLIMGLDVIHGLKTVFPIPLAESCSFDDELFEQTAAAAAKESWNIGIDWTYAPMIDIARDSRWGRIAEGAGQDTYLASRYAAAKVRGFQGDDLSKNGNIASCAKHYVAYGACEGGVDYDAVDMSLQKLWNVYMPPFKSAVEAGAVSVMTAFNDLNGIPCTANSYLLKDVLKTQFDFDGVIVSDSMSVEECVAHGYAVDRKDAAGKCIDAGLDMDMHSRCFIDHLCELVREGTISEEVIDEAVRRVLRLKFRLGLFDNPYRDINAVNDPVLAENNRKLAHRAARESIVLLKNNGVLPLLKKKKIAVVGSLADMPYQMIGTWAREDLAIKPVTLFEGINGRTECRYFLDVSEFEAQKENFDFVVVAVGENRAESGEAASRAYIGLSEEDKKLIEIVKQTGKKIITVLFNGRPLAIPEVVEASDAVIEAWHLGLEAGSAIADVIFGDYNPSGRLTVEFPNRSGQTPIYYNHLKTGKPARDFKFSARYQDTSYSPLFPFGYGLSYTEYKYSDLSVVVNEDNITVGVTVKNTGDMDGTEIVQLYIQDVVGSIVRPVKELKGYKRVELATNEEKRVEFIIKKSELCFYDNELNYVVESGEFKLWIGHDSTATLCSEFIL